MTQACRSRERPTYASGHDHNIGPQWWTLVCVQYPCTHEVDGSRLLLYRRISQRYLDPLGKTHGTYEVGDVIPGTIYPWALLVLLPPDLRVLHGEAHKLTQTGGVKVP